MNKNNKNIVIVTFFLVLFVFLFTAAKVSAINQRYDTDSRGQEIIFPNSGDIGPYMWYDSTTNRTYILWTQRPYEDGEYGIENFACYYDHTTGQMSESVSVGTYYPDATDPHGEGAIIVTNSGYILAAFEELQNGGDLHGSPFLISRSTAPATLSFPTIISNKSLQIESINIVPFLCMIYLRIPNHNFVYDGTVTLTGISGITPSLNGDFSFTTMDEDDIYLSDLCDYEGSYNPPPYGTATAPGVNVPVIDDGLTYPHLFKLGDRIYLSGRYSNGYIALYHSDDEGSTWSGRTNIVNLEYAHWSYHTRVNSPNNDKIRIAINDQDRTDTTVSRIIYYIESSDGDTFINVKGNHSHCVSIDGALTSTELYDYYLLKDSGSNDTEILVSSSSISPTSGRIYFLVEVHTPPGNTPTGPYRRDYNLMYWDGSQFQYKPILQFSNVSFPTFGDYYKRDRANQIFAYNDNIIDLFGSVSVDDVLELQRWRTYNAGDTWVKVEDITSGSPYDIVNTQIPANASLTTPLILASAYRVEVGSSYSDLWIYGSNTISGKVTLKGGDSDVADVLLTLNGNLSETTNPDTDGNYSFIGLEDGSYTVTPSLTGYHFFPSNHSYSPLDNDQTDQDFTGLYDTYDGNGDGIPDWWEMTFPNNNNNYRCFLTTLFSGTSMSGGIKTFRGFRDTYLCTNPVGKIFANSYYRVSPPLANFVREHPVLKSVARDALRPIIWLSQKAE